jgi:hypothetical protein
MPSAINQAGVASEPLWKDLKDPVGVVRVRIRESAATLVGDRGPAGAVCAQRVSAHGGIDRATARAPAGHRRTGGDHERDGKRRGWPGGPG